MGGNIYWDMVRSKAESDVSTSHRKKQLKLVSKKGPK